jgi:hypothetical protein
MRIHFHGGGDHTADEDKGQSLPTPSKLSEELRFLDPASVAFDRVGGRLNMTGPDGDERQPVTLVHVFPLSEKEAWISVLDKEGHEIGILKTLKGLPEESLKIAREELRRRYVVPLIRRVLACRERHDLVEWKVETDRGSATFLTRNVREQVQEPVPNHFSIADVEGNRYDVPDLLALDPASRAFLMQYL